MSDKRTYAIIRSPAQSGKGKVIVQYTTYTSGGHRKAAHNYAKSLCTQRQRGKRVGRIVKKATSPYCKYKVHVVDLAKLKSEGPGTLVRVYEVTRHKFTKVRKVDIGSVTIPTKGAQKVRFSTSYRIPNITSVAKSNSFR